VTRLYAMRKKICSNHERCVDESTNILVQSAEGREASRKCLARSLDVKRKH